ncbi:MAG: MFS transporter, partial [Lachnospiraceae bacterium]|nr:MFS transporter [Lachnospiraceae bacterium]
MGNEMKKVGFLAKFSIGFGVFGQSLLTGIVTSYILFFGTDILGVSAMAISNLLLISKLFDGVTDLGMGVVLDKTKSKNGKARPWIARAVIPYVLFSILLFGVPQNFGNGMKLVWIFVAYNLYALAYTALGIAMNTLNIRLSRDEKEINSISTVLMFGTIFGNVVINAVAVGALTALSGSETFTQAGFMKLTAILGAVCTIGGFASYFTTMEIPDDELKAEVKPSSVEGIRSLVKNKYWLMQVANTFFIYFGLNARLAAMVY